MTMPVSIQKRSAYHFDTHRRELAAARRHPYKKKITLGIVIDTDLSIPPKTGVTYRLYYLSKRLAEKGLKVKIFLCNRSSVNKEDAKKIFSKSAIEFHFIPPETFYNAAAMARLIRENLPTILQVEDTVSLLRFHRIAESLRIPICLEMHDVEATLQEELGFKSADIEISKVMVHMAVRLADRTICMTETDREEMIRQIGADTNAISLIPNPIDLREFPCFGPKSDAKNILFIGNMFYWPNRNAAKFIIDRLYPALTKKERNARFTLAGMIPHDLAQTALKKPGITVLGSTDRLNDVLKNATIAICPVTEGSGMKVKILNYCAAGLPVITTKIGASGYEHIGSLIIEDNLAKYPELLANLLADKKKLSAIGKRNRACVEQHYSIERISKTAIEMYRDTLATHTALKTMKSSGRTIALPLPLWRKEKRAKRSVSSEYYVVTHGTTSRSKKFRTDRHR